MPSYSCVMSLNTPIALGSTAEIYTWKEDQVLKLFNSGISCGTVEHEAWLTRLAHATGLPVPEVGEIIEIAGRYGLEYERVDGITMLQALYKKPWLAATFARQLAELQAKAHKISMPEMPSQHEQLERKINQASQLTGDLRQAALSALEQLPQEDKLCHGDFHPNNIVLTPPGPVIIDWIDATRGLPLADVARSTLLFGGGPLPKGVPWWVSFVRGWFYRVYIRSYTKLNPMDKRKLPTWVGVCAAARLAENTRYDEPWLLALARTLAQGE